MFQTRPRKLRWRRRRQCQREGVHATDHVAESVSQGRGRRQRGAPEDYTTCEARSNLIIANRESFIDQSTSMGDVFPQISTAIFGV